MMKLCSQTPWFHVENNENTLEILVVDDDDDENFHKKS